MMPNLPVSVGEGVTQYCGLGTTEKELSDFAILLSSSGVVSLISEDMMDVACAVSGSGPAYCAMMIDALADGAVACGMSREEAQRQAAQALVDFGKIMQQYEEENSMIVDDLCSYIDDFVDREQFRSGCIAVVTSSYKKSQAIGEES